MDEIFGYWVGATFLVFLGLVGLVIPAVPGTPLIFAGLLLAAWAENFPYVGLWSIVALALIALLLRRRFLGNHVRCAKVWRIQARRGRRADWRARRTFLRHTRSDFWSIHRRRARRAIGATEPAAGGPRRYRRHHRAYP